jgi:putative transposase
VLWFNTEHPHEYLDDFTPEAVEKLHYDHRRTHQKRGDSTQPVFGLPGRLILHPN